MKKKSTRKEQFFIQWLNLLSLYEDFKEHPGIKIATKILLKTLKVFVSIMVRNLVMGIMDIFVD